MMKPSWTITYLNIYNFFAINNSMRYFLHECYEKSCVESAFDLMSRSEPSDPVVEASNSRAAT